MPSQPANLMSYLRMMVASWKDDPRDDAELLSRFAETRDETAFATIVGRHGPLVWRTCRQILGNTPDAEDALQTVFLAMSRQAGKFPVKSLSGWLHKVARRTALNAQVVTRRQQKREEELQVEPLAKKDTDSGQNDLYAALDEELAGLPERLRVPLLLHYLEGKSQVEVARVLGCARSVLQKRLTKGEAVLRERLERRGLTLGAVSMAALLGNIGSASTIPSRLIESTAQAAVAFRDGTLTSGTATAAQKLLWTLSVESAVRTSWWMALVSFCFLGFGGVARIAWKMSAARPDMSASPAAPMPIAKSCGERVDRYGDPLPEGALARMGTCRFRPGFDTDGWGNAVAFMPDGKALVSVHYVANDYKVQLFCSSRIWKNAPFGLV